MTGVEARWQAVMTLFDEAMDAAPEERQRLLAEHMAVDREVAEEVQSLLASLDSVGDRFARPAMAMLGNDANGWLAPPVATLEGQQVGAYAVEQKIGEGGMGAVYAAVRVNDSFRQRVALKTISRGADSRAIVQRFQRERRILAGLQHPNIAAMFDGGVTDAGTPYYVMEYVDGLAIDAWCTHQQLGVTQRLDLFRQVCGAVQYAHRHLVVHRDIKPGNVMVSSDGVVKLLDFGIAKVVSDDTDGHPGDASVTHDGLTPHTMAYASPEQVRGETVSTATDVYSLGVVLYQLLSGVAPFPTEGRTPAEILTAVANDAPAPPSMACTNEAAASCGLGTRDRLSRALSGELDAIVLMAMRKEPERRYVSAEALADDVHRFLRGLPVSARPDTFGYRMRKFVARQRALTFMGATTFLALAGAFVFWVWQSRLMRLEVARTTRISNFMQSVLGAADLTGVGGSLPHVGPEARIGALLDSALVQVPIEFPDDPAVRARLYRTLGSGLMSQSRNREAFNILDSAVALSKLAYGPTSPEFALASNEAGLAALMRNHLDEATALTTAGKLALEQSGRTDSELYAQSLVNLASIALVRGEYPAMDSLASRALALETKRTAEPTLSKAIAMNRLASWLSVRGQYAAADSQYRAALAQLDALRATSSVEHIDVLGNLISSAMQQGRLPRADSLARRGLTLATDLFGPNSRETALMLGYASALHSHVGDTAHARVLIDRAVRILDSIPEVIAPVRAIIMFSHALDFITRAEWAAADTVLTRSREALSITKKGFPLFAALLYGGIVRTMLRDFEAAEPQFLEAERVYTASAMQRPGELQLLRQSMAAFYTRTSRPAEAEKYFRELPADQVAGIKAYALREHRADSMALAQRAAAAKGSASR